MKHNSVIISGSDLCGAFGSYDSQDVADLLGFSDYESIDWSGYWHVSWPEHVSSPHYNSDANYSFMATLEEARDYNSEAELYDSRYELV
jgi:hypothetical protein